MKFSPSLAPRGLAVALGALALAAPAAVAQSQDLRAPDNQAPMVAVVDLRSPDAKDVIKPTPRVAEPVGPRGGIPHIVHHRAAPVAKPSDDGFDWSSPGIVAGAAGGFLLLALGGLTVAYRTRLRPAR